MDERLGRRKEGFVSGKSKQTMTIQTTPGRSTTQSGDSVKSPFSSADFFRGGKKTPFENFEGLVTKLLRVPKEELDEKRSEQEKAHKRKRA